MTTLALVIEDDGQGMSVEPATRHDGLGLRIMEYRARMIGGSLLVSRSKAGGVAVRCSAPVVPGAGVSPINAASR